MPGIEQDHNHGDFGAADQVIAAETSRTAAATIEARKKLPDACASRPATTGPTIWPMPNDAVMSAKIRRGARGTSSLAVCKPSAVTAMKVTPSRTPASNGPTVPPMATLAVTPITSIRQPRA